MNLLRKQRYFRVFKAVEMKSKRAMITTMLVAVAISAALIASSLNNPMDHHFLFATTTAFGSDVSDLSSDALAGFIYVQNTNSNNISVVDLKTNTNIKNITVERPPQKIELSEDQQILYILTTDGDSATIYKANATTNELMNDKISAPVSIGDFTIFNGTLYLSDTLGGKILVMSANGTFVNEINVGSRPQFVEVRPDGQVLYVTSLGGNISVADLKQNSLMKEINSSSVGHSLSFDRNGERAYVVNDENDSISLFNSQKHNLIKTIAVGDNPKNIVLNPDETLAYVTNMDSNTISIVDTQVFEVIDEIPAGNGPYGIAFSADGGDLSYVSNTKGNDLSIVNTTSGKVINTIPAGSSGPTEVVAKKPEIGIVRDLDNNNIDNNNKRDNVTSFVIARIFAEIPDESDEFERGLMFREHLPTNAGMLSAFNDEEPRTFWM